MRISWISNELATKLGLDTEEKKQEFLRLQEETGTEEAKKWLNEKMRLIQNKDIQQIPRGDYCYERWLPEEAEAEFDALVEKYGELSGEALIMYSERSQTRDCPYWEHTDYGTIKCHFLEEEVVGWPEEERTKAAAHFGSEEEANRICTGSMVLSDSVRCCNRVLNALEGKPR